MECLVRFKKEHLQNLDEHVYGLSVRQSITDAQLEALEKRKYTYSVVKDDVVYAVLGITEYWPGRGEVWAILKKDLGQDFLMVNACAKHIMDSYSFSRYEAVVNLDFKNGIRWMKSLGFDVEAPLMKKYGRDGKDCVLMSRVQE